MAGISQLVGPQQFLLYGEAHEVLPGDDAHHLEGVVDHHKVPQAKAPEDVVGPVEAESAVHVHGAPVDEGPQVDPEPVGVPKFFCE